MNSFSFERVNQREIREGNVEPKSIDQWFSDRKEIKQEYQRFVDFVQVSAQGCTCVTAADALFTEVKRKIELFQCSPFLTRTEEAFYRGRLVRILRDVDNELGENLPLHRFCGCSIDPKQLVSAAERTNMYGKVVLSYSWNLGAGHAVAQQGMTERCASLGMHVYNIEADTDTLRPVLDSLWHFTDGRISDGDVLRWFMRHNYFKTLRWISQCFGGKPKPETTARIGDQFVRQLLRVGTPDLQLTIYARHTGLAANVAAQYGVPTIHVDTDLDTGVVGLFDIKKLTDINLPQHFSIATMIDEKNSKAAREEGFSIECTGFPVRQGFLQEYDVDALRKENGVADGARVVVLGSGGEGVENGYAEYLVNAYSAPKAKDYPPIHLVVLCGKNAQKKQILEKKFSSLALPNLRVQILGWATSDTLGPVYAMAADSRLKGALISTKAGGGTTSEGLATGVPMLLPRVVGFDWEKDNIRMVCETLQAGITFNGEEDLVPRLHALFNQRFERLKHDSWHAPLRLIQERIDQEEKDPTFTARRNLKIS